MPRFPMMRVIGSQAISTTPSGCVATCSPYFGDQRGSYPDVSSSPGWCHLGSWLAVLFVTLRSVRINRPYGAISMLDTTAPGGSSMNGMNLSGNPGIVHPMQMPPTFGQPPMPSIHPRLATLQLTTGPQHPTLTRHLGEL